VELRRVAGRVPVSRAAVVVRVAVGIPRRGPVPVVNRPVGPVALPWVSLGVRAVSPVVPPAVSLLVRPAVRRLVPVEPGSPVVRVGRQSRLGVVAVSRPVVPVVFSRVVQVALSRVVPVVAVPCLQQAVSRRRAGPVPSRVAAPTAAVRRSRLPATAAPAGRGSGRPASSARAPVTRSPAVPPPAA
jgi:hypothetical protein